MPSEKRKARKQNYFKAAKQSRKVQEVSPRKNIIGNKSVLKQQKGKSLLAKQLSILMCQSRERDIIGNAIFDNNGRGHENIFDMKSFLLVPSYYKTIKPCYLGSSTIYS